MTTSPKKRAKTSKHQQKRSATPWLIGLGVALVILVPTGINLYGQSQLPGERFRNLGNVHIGTDAPTPSYNSNPPTSGPHYPSVGPWGTHTELSPALSDPYLIHNMEDAGVILWYRAGTPQENRERATALEGAYDARRYRRVVIVPRENMDTMYAMTAWQRLQTFEEIAPDQIDAFMEAYEGVDHHPAGGA